MTTTVGVVSNYESAVFLVEDNSDRESVATIIDSLLASVCSSRPEDLSDSILKDIANFLRKEAAMNPSVQNIFLKHFPNLPKPVPFITIVPYIFCSASPQIRNDVIIQLFNLADTNSMFLLPALSALIEFPLSTQAVHQLSDYVSEYADTINKEDLTTFFKVVIKANSHIEVEETITKIRRKLILLDIYELATVLDMLLGELPGNSNVARIIIDDLLTIQKKKLSIGEVAIVLVILSIGKENNGTEILSKWFDEGLYPQKEFIEIITMRSRMKVCGKLIPSIWKCCKWLITKISTTKSRSNNVNKQIEGLYDTTKAVVELVPSMKQTVIDYLIQTTFQSHVAGAFDPLESNKDNLSPIPQLGKAFDHVIGKVSSKKESVSDIIHRALLVNSSTNRTILSKPRNIGYSARQQQRVLQFLNMAVLSSNLLLYLSNLVPEVGSELMKVLSNKILNRPSEEELYLPAPMISASILRAIAKSVAIVPGIENTLIIIIQKLIVSVERSTSALRIQNSFNYALQMRNSTISCQYRPVTISVMILQHFLWRGSPQLSSNDQQTFLRLLQRSLYNFNDSALVLTLDTFIGYIKLYKKRLKQSNQAENDLPTFEKQVFACLDHVYKTHQIFKRDPTSYSTVISGLPTGFRTTLVCLSSDHKNIDSFSSTGNTRLGEERVWEVSSVASWIMHQALKTQEEIDPSETKLVRKSIDTLCSNLFWLVQRMAVLESMLSDIEQTNYRTKTVRITLFNHTNNEKNEAQDGIYDSQIFSHWACGAADSFSGEYYRPGELSREFCLRLSWERTICAATASCNMNLVACRQERSASCVMPDDVSSIVKVVCQLHSARYMLRAAHVGVSKKHLVKSKRRTSTPSRKRKNLDPDDDQFISGKDLKISTSNSVSKVKEIALSECYSCACEALESCVDSNLLRLQGMIEPDSLLKTIAWLACISDESNFDVNATVGQDCSEDVGLLLTDVGLGCLGIFCWLLLLPSRLVIEVDAETTSSSSSSTPSISIAGEKHCRRVSDLCSQSSNIFYEEQFESSSTFDIRSLTEVLKKLPLIISLANKERKRLNFLLVNIDGAAKPESLTENKNKSSTPKKSIDFDVVSHCGNRLDYHGQKYFILVLLAILEYLLSNSDIIGNPIVDLKRKNDNAKDCPTVTTQNIENGSIIDNAEEILGLLSSCLQGYSADLNKGEKTLLVINYLEMVLREQQDAVLSIAFYRILRMVTKETTLKARLSAIAWHQFCSLYTESLELLLLPNSGTHEESSANKFGTDTIGIDPSMKSIQELYQYDLALNQLLIDLQTAIRTLPKKTISGKKVPTMSNNRMKNKARKNHYGTCNQTYIFELIENYSYDRKVTRNVHDANIMTTIKFYFINWWTYETNTDNRIYGLSHLLRDVFRCEFFGLIDLTSMSKNKKRTVDEDQDLLHKETPQYSKFFPNLTEETIEDHLIFSLSLIPSLLIISMPTNNNQTETVGDQRSPYYSFFIITNTLRYSILRLVEIAQVAGIHMAMIAKNMNKFMKIYRGCLEAIEIYIDSAIVWRSQQHVNDNAPTSVINDHLSLQRLKRNSELRNDLGTVKYFETLFKQAVLVLKTMLSFTHAFKEIYVVSHNFDIPKILHRTIPSVELRIGKLIHKLSRTARTYGIQLESLDITDNSDELRDYDAATKQSIGSFLKSYSSIIYTPATEWSLNSTEVVTETRDDPDDTNYGNDSDSSDEDSGFGWGVKVQNAAKKEKPNENIPSGWGLYDAQYARQVQQDGQISDDNRDDHDSDSEEDLSFTESDEDSSLI